MARLPFSSYLFGVGILLSAVIFSAAVGSVSLSKIGIVKEFIDVLPWVEIESGLSATHQNILWNFRMPRIVMGAIVGSSLAVSGAAYQGVFRNPLADPYLLGVASGAGLGATIAIAFSASLPFAALASWGPFRPIAFFAFSGALIAVLLTVSLARAAGSSSSHLLLAGIAVVAFFTSIQTYILHRNTEIIEEVFVWILGGLSVSGWSDILYLIPYLLLCGSIILLHSRHLDVLRLGDAEAKSVGADPQKVRFVIVAAATLLTSAAVSVSGLISFVGLVVPHLVRLVSGWSYKVILPLSALHGATFLILADSLSRIVSRSPLPIGVVTAAIGAPFFAFLLIYTARKA